MLIGSLLVTPEAEPPGLNGMGESVMFTGNPFIYTVSAVTCTLPVFCTLMVKIVGVVVSVADVISTVCKVESVEAYSMKNLYRKIPPTTVIAIKINVATIGETPRTLFCTML